MWESQAELDALQELMDRSYESSGDHLRDAFQQSKRPTASRLIEAMPGIFETHLAVVSGSGAPLVAPIDAMWFHGRIWLGLAGRSLRARLVRRDSRVSTSFVGSGVALIAHGLAVAADHAASAEFEEASRDVYVAMYGPQWLDWQAARQATPGPPSFTGFIEPRVLFATAA